MPDPRKDVDGLHPINIGYLTLGVDRFSPCAPLARIEILRRYNVCLEGKKTLVIGHSNVVAKPIAAMLVHENATLPSRIHFPQIYRNFVVRVMHERN